MEIDKQPLQEDQQKYVAVSLGCIKRESKLR